MKTCCRCRIELPIDNFAKKKNGTQSFCKECNKKYQRQHYLNNKSIYKKKAKSYKKMLTNRVRKIKESSPCIDCGYHYHYCQMDFDHIGNKNFNISEGVGNLGKSWETIEKEILICELVCSNCHRLRTFNRSNSPTQN